MTHLNGINSTPIAQNTHDAVLNAPLARNAPTSHAAPVKAMARDAEFSMNDLSMMIATVYMKMQAVYNDLNAKETHNQVQGLNNVLQKNLSAIDQNFKAEQDKNIAGIVTSGVSLLGGTLPGFTRLGSKWMLETRLQVLNAAGQATTSGVGIHSNNLQLGEGGAERVKADADLQKQFIELRAQFANRLQSQADGFGQEMQKMLDAVTQLQTQIVSASLPR
jgi:hypothetical protein